MSAATRRRPRRTAAGLLVGAVAAFVLGYLRAVTTPGVSYSWRHNMISDLGRTSCRTDAGDWICSPGSGWFNLGSVVAGVCLVAAVVLLRRDWGAVLGTTLGLLGVGLVVLAAYPSDSDPRLHMVGAVLTLPVPALGLLLSGIRPGTAWLRRDRVLRLALGLLGLTACLDHLVMTTLLPPRGMAETVTMATLLGFLTVEAARCWAVRGATGDPSA